ncbi:MAG: hypothetical protein V3T72_01780 [Thermoanaerobaculia bacterium]
MNEVELQRLMTAEESESLEFKRSLLSRKEIGEYAGCRLCVPILKA